MRHLVNADEVGFRHAAPEALEQGQKHLHVPKLHVGRSAVADASEALVELVVVCKVADNASLLYAEAAS